MGSGPKVQRTQDPAGDLGHVAGDSSVSLSFLIFERRAYHFPPKLAAGSKWWAAQHPAQRELSADSRAGPSLHPGLQVPGCSFPSSPALAEPRLLPVISYNSHGRLFPSKQPHHLPGTGDCGILQPQCACLGFPFLTVAGLVSQAAFLKEAQGDLAGCQPGHVSSCPELPRAPCCPVLLP